MLAIEDLQGFRLSMSSLSYLLCLVWIGDEPQPILLGGLGILSLGILGLVVGSPFDEMVGAVLLELGCLVL